MSWPKRLIRIFAVTSLLSSLSVIIICGWTFGSILYVNRSGNVNQTNNYATAASYTYTDKRYQSSQIPYEEVSNHFENSDNVTQMDTSTTGNETTTSLNNHNNDRQEIEEDNNIDTLNSDNHHWIIINNNYTATFKGMLQVFSWLGIITGLVQTSSLFPIFCGPQKRLFTYSKFTVGFHFLCLIIFLACFFTPMVFNGHCNVDDTIAKESSANCSMTMKTVSQFSKRFEQDLKHLPKDPIEFLRDNLNAYYTFIGIDCVIIFICIIVFCCLLRFDDQYTFI